jgi:hypothetical protein
MFISRIILLEVCSYYWFNIHPGKVEIILFRFLYGHFYKKQKGAAHPLRIAGVALGMLTVLINIGFFGFKAYNSLK